jgi:peptidase E
VTDRHIVALGGGGIADFDRAGGDLREQLLGADAVYVAGGNTANMLAIWRLHGVDAILPRRGRRGWCSSAEAPEGCAGSTAA